MTAPPPPHGTATQYEQQQRDEWSRYIALVPIDFYGMRAYNPGDPVPASAVVEGEPTGEPGGPWILQDWVAVPRGDRPVESATVPPPGQPAIDPANVAAPPGAAAAPPPDSSDDGSTVTSSEG